MQNYLEHLNKAFESKARLGIMSVLATGESVDFTTLKEFLGLTDGNLASHTRSLETLGYIASAKQFVGRKPNTTFRATEVGLKAFAEHIDALEAFLRQNTQ